MGNEARIMLAQNQPNEAEEEKKRRERQKGKGEQGQGGQQGQGQRKGDQGGQGGHEKRQRVQEDQGNRGNQGQDEQKRRKPQEQGQGGGQDQGQDNNKRRRLQEQGQGGGQGQGNQQGQDDNKRRRLQEQGQGGGQGQGNQQGQDDNKRRRLQEQGQGGGQGQGNQQGQDEIKRRKLQEQGQGGGQGQGNQQGQDEIKRRKLQEQGQGGGQGQGNQQGQDDSKRRKLQEQGQGGGQGQGNQQGQDEIKRRKLQEQGQGGGQGQGNQQGQDEIQRRKLQEQGQGGGQGQDKRFGGEKTGPGGKNRAERAARNRDRKPEERLRNGFIAPAEQQQRRQERAEFSREKLKDITGQRKERREKDGRIVIVEPGNRLIERDNGKIIIRHDESERLRGPSRNYRVERGEAGRNRIIIDRPDGEQIIVIQGDDGRLLRRIKRFRDGREIILINNESRGGGRYRDRDRRPGFGFYLNLPEFTPNIPSDEYYVDADDASEEDIERALSAPPIEALDGDYTLDEIRFNRGLRQRLRRVNLSSINFEFGAWDIRPEQIGNLQEVADAIKSILRRNPDEVFLVAGYTDAVGSDEDNLSLSDRRVETVARVLTDEFGVPPENLVTQGYGEQDLLIPSQGPEVRNRRVEFMRITPYLAQKDQ